MTVVIVTVAVPPIDILPTNSMSLGPYGLGGTIKSDELTAFPSGVVTETRPDPVAVGTVAAMLVALTVPNTAFEILNDALSFEAVVSKLVPVIVTEVPAGPDVGVKLVIVGAPRLLEPTVNEFALVAEPTGLVTLMVPVVAPEGTVTTIRLVLEADTVAGVPLKVTVFWFAVALKPEP